MLSALHFPSTFSCANTKQAALVVLTRATLATGGGGTARPPTSQRRRTALVLSRYSSLPQGTPLAGRLQCSFSLRPTAPGVLRLWTHRATAFAFSPGRTSLPLPLAPDLLILPTPSCYAVSLSLLPCRGVVSLYERRSGPLERRPPRVRGRRLPGRLDGLGQARLPGLEACEGFFKLGREIVPGHGLAANLPEFGLAAVRVDEHVAGLSLCGQSGAPAAKARCGLDDLGPLGLGRRDRREVRAETFAVHRVFVRHKKSMTEALRFVFIFTGQSLLGSSFPLFHGSCSGPRALLTLPVPLRAIGVLEPGLFAPLTIGPVPCVRRLGVASLRGVEGEPISEVFAALEGAQLLCNVLCEVLPPHDLGLPEENAMVLLGRCLEDSTGFLERIEEAQVHALAVNAYPGVPLVLELCPVNTLLPAGVVRR